MRAKINKLITQDIGLRQPRHSHHILRFLRQLCFPLPNDGLSQTTQNPDQPVPDACVQSVRLDHGTHAEENNSFRGCVQHLFQLLREKKRNLNLSESEIDFDREKLSQCWHWANSFGLVKQTPRTFSSFSRHVCFHFCLHSCSPFDTRSDRRGKHVGKSKQCEEEEKGNALRRLIFCRRKLFITLFPVSSSFKLISLA